MVYGPEGQLLKQIETNTSTSANTAENTGPKTTIHIGSLYEQISDQSGITHRYHIAVRGGVTSVINHKENQTPKTHYLHRDHLDSIVAISDDNGQLLERYHFDAFGQRRTAIVNPSDVLNQTVFTPPTIGDAISQRGFTGHVRLAGIGLIHMKGRLYDATIGRFISADPQVQFTYDLQSFNRYSYTHNNPLKFIDPSGYGFFSKLFKGIKKAFKKIVKAVVKVVKKVVKFVKTYWKVILTIAIVVIAPYAVAAYMNGVALTAATTSMVAGLSAGATVAAGAIGGGLAGFITTGSLKGALIGAVSGAAFAGIGNAFNGAGNVGRWISGLSKGAQRVLKVVSHGVAGGLRAVASGGKFKAGFAAAGFTAFASPAIGNSGLSPAGEVVAAGVVGGIGSRIGGGSFEDGFVTGAFSHGFNAMLHQDAIPISKTDRILAQNANAASGGDRNIYRDAFWEGRWVDGDPLAGTALQIVRNEGFLGTSANNLAKLGGASDLEALGVDLISAHINATDSDTSGIPHNLGTGQIRDYHNTVFDNHSISRHAYGGKFGFGWLYCPNCDPVN